MPPNNCTPHVVQCAEDGSIAQIVATTRSPLTSGHDEDWLQRLLFQAPELLAVHELDERIQAPLVPLGMEIGLPSGICDNLYISKDGYLVIVETKLWRNPQSRREVVAQILDYGTHIRRWDYAKLEQEWRKAGSRLDGNLWEHVEPQEEEAEWIDMVSRNLQAGRMALIIAGDGIREEAWDLAETVNGHPDFEFRLGLVEIRLFRTADNAIVAIPAIQTRTKEIISGVTITRFMSKHGLEGGVALEETASSAASDVLTDKEGRQYAIGGMVAKGGMGAILSARDLNIRRTVAMKVMLDPKKADDKKVLRFIEEAQVTGQLEHPSIVPVHELGVDAHDNVFYTMKFVKGVTLKDILKNIAAGDAETIHDYPLGRLLTVFSKVCDAIGFAHSKGVVHRDLKPENIMVGEHGEAVVMDWGLAKVLSGSGRPGPSSSGKLSVTGQQEAPRSGPSRATGVSAIDSVRSDAVGEVFKSMDGQIMGTPQFMAPEQALGKKDLIEARTDIYALGAILYSILTLQAPIRGKNIGQVLLNVSRGTITPPNDVLSPAARAAGSKGKKGKVADVAEIQQRATTAVRHAHDRPTSEAQGFAHCPAGRIPAPLAAVAMKALALEQSDRYPSAKMLQEDVDAYQGGFATTAEEAGAARQLWLLAKRHAAVVGVAAVAMVVLAVVLAFAFVRVTREKNDAVVARHEAEASAAEAKAARAAQAALSKQAAPKFLREARRFADMKEWTVALDVAATAVVLDPELREAWFFKGLLDLGARNFDAAEAAFGKARERVSPVTREHQTAKRYQSLARQCRGLVAKVGGKRDNDIAYALARALEKCGEYEVSKRLYAESGKPRSGQQSLEVLALIKGIEGANPGLKPEQIQVLSGSGRPGPRFPAVGSESRGPGGPAPLSGEAGLHVTCHYDALVDVTPLAGTNVRDLDLSLTQVRHIAPLAGLKLVSLNLAGTRVMDLSPLAKMPLAHLDLHRTNISNIADLAALPLVSLNLANTKVVNLAPLAPSEYVVPALAGPGALERAGRGTEEKAPAKAGTTYLGLRRLDLTGTAIVDLTPLKGLALEELILDRTSVADLAPLGGMPLKVLSIAGTPVTDLTPLAGMALESLHYIPANIAKGLDIVQSMPCAKAVVGRPWSISELGTQFIPITPGSFVREDGVKVALTKPFWMGKCEVTQAEYQAIMGTNPSAFKGERLPVETVSWHDAVAFCAKLTERERAAGRLPPGSSYRLPTEAEWEYCCRAGTTTEYSFGDDPALLCKYANYRDKSSERKSGPEAWEKTDFAHDDGFKNTAPVGSLEPNPWSLYNMHGNVREWCLDWHGSYVAGDAVDPVGPGAGSLRVRRGGSWSLAALISRSARRGGFAPDYRSLCLGFRLVRTVP